MTMNKQTHQQVDVNEFLKTYFEWDESEFEPQVGFVKVSMSALKQLINEWDGLKAGYAAATTQREQDIRDAFEAGCNHGMDVWYSEEWGMDISTPDLETYIKQALKK